MILIGNVEYDVDIRMPSGNFYRTRMWYCGGSMVDSNGHHIAFGIWAKDAYIPGKRHHIYLNDRTGTYHKNNIIPVPRSGRSEYHAYDDMGEQQPLPEPIDPKVLYAKAIWRRNMHQCPNCGVHKGDWLDWDDHCQQPDVRASCKKCGHVIYENKEWPEFTQTM